MHASLDQAKYFYLGRVEPWVGFKNRIYNSSLAIAKVRHIHGAPVAKIGYSSISAFATRPGRHLIGWVDRF